MMQPPNHYGKDYFQWQKRIGEFAGKVNPKLFQDYIKGSDIVIEFGCGGAYLLKNIRCSRSSVGIEINPYARDIAKVNGIRTVAFAKDLPDEYADVAISDCVLEHVDTPLLELKTLHSKLKPNGKIVFVIPQEVNVRFTADDINQHLYAWSESTAGNLFTKAGFTVKKIDTIKKQWPPYYSEIYNYLGEIAFEISCRLYAMVRPRIYMIRVVAVKEAQV